MRIAVFGTGHVGLVTSITLSSLGHDVTGTDVDRGRLVMLADGEAPFHEPGLPQMLREQIATGRLAFTPDPDGALHEARVAFICVGTPPRIDGTANLLAVEQTARTIARHAEDGVVVAEKSTVPTGTAARLRPLMARERPRLSSEVVSNPEFLREGSALRDSLEPARILIGAETARGFSVMREVYGPLTSKGIPLIETDVMTAELAKHASNAFLALKISFANALARICERTGADVLRVADVMGADARIGRAFLGAGLGYGGSCFPKDLAAFDRLSSDLGYDFALLREAARINEEALDVALDRVRDALWNLEEKRVALLGLAYKPGTDDLRFSPAMELARRLMAQGVKVAGYDPEAGGNARAHLPDLRVASDPYEAATGADCVVLCTSWSEFADLDLARLREAMAYPIVIDGRNFFDPERMRDAGFTYYPTGRPPVQPDPIEA
jgi:UDPglucose 6-dehydrogenase